MYIYVLIKFQQLEYHYEKKIFFQKMMNFLACLIPYYLAKSLYSDQYTYTAIVLTKVGQKRGERPVSYRVQNWFQYNENGWEWDRRLDGVKYRRDRC